MFGKHFRRLLLIAVSALTLALAIAPAGFAGEDDDDDTTTTEAPAAPVEENSGSESSSSGGSSDTQVAVKGVQTGAGGMASADAVSILLPVGLGGAGIILLASTGAGALAIRRK